MRGGGVDFVSNLAQCWVGDAFGEIIEISFWLLWQPEFLEILIAFSNPKSGYHIEHLCEVSSQLTQWFRRGYNLKILTHFLKLPWQPQLSQNWNYFSNITIGPHKEQYTIRFLINVDWVVREEMHFEKNVDDGRKR